MTYRIALISDTHLSGDKPYFVGNFDRVSEALQRATPDLVVNTGDMALDGANLESDLVAARYLHDQLRLPVACIPGNHDIGEAEDVPGAGQAVLSKERRDRYLRQFGSDFWMRDVPGWRLIGVNAQLLGSPLDSAGEQEAFVADTVSTASGRSLALFIHKPLFDRTAGEETIGGRFVNPASRRRLAAAFGGIRPSLVASGHVHRYRSVTIDGRHHIWAPSTAFILPDAVQPIYGEKQVGYVELDFDSDGSHQSRLVRVPGLPLLNIEDYPDAYADAHAQSH